MIFDLIHRIQRKWMKMRLEPIRVFCFHHVSDERDPLVCQVEDWTQLKQFKHNIMRLKVQYTFISLAEAQEKLKHDWIRLNKYAVLTTDDGFASVMNVLPWLETNRIPVTLFVNTRYMKGDILKPVHRKWLHELAPDADEKEIAKRMYLSKEQVWALNSQYIEIGMHGHAHLDATEISEELFEEDVIACEKQLSMHARYISAFAYPWGKITKESMKYLHSKGITPVLVNGEGNYEWDGYIDRECMDNKILK